MNKDNDNSLMELIKNCKIDVTKWEYEWEYERLKLDKMYINFE